ncbi:glycosyl hydrolase family 15 [Penicillium maclennaniae]|uniref:glycosyl hydrolase family 15 n=1 Tax=Penicillium maclennaniae TaxID=1343394 RepID=UPI002541D4C4|nr:glycosyl hydrolase family 15 [Penicillium maclennaniae]KAJ5676556.1 glycosyl hydrolase family 15 [Penicillium maclennaniae]
MFGHNILTLALLASLAPAVTFIQSETSIALQGVLYNVGANGTNVAGASSGVVVASPSKSNPNYYYTWTRDADLTLAMVVESFIAGETSLETVIQQYIAAQATVQTISSPSGGSSDGAGLGEPKFNVNLTALLKGDWGRPQRDGPALRASALIAYGNYLVSAEKDLRFFRDLLSSAEIGNDSSSLSTYSSIASAFKAYANGFYSIVEQNTPNSGSLAEQFSRDTGTALSARDLTWSYAAFLTAAARKLELFLPVGGPPKPTKCHPSAKAALFLRLTQLRRFQRGD